jgi:hypothetical protein
MGQLSANKRHHCPSEFTKTIHKHPLVERPDLLRMVVLLMIGADYHSYQLNVVSIPPRNLHSLRVVIGLWSPFFQLMSRQCSPLRANVYVRGQNLLTSSGIYQQFLESRSLFSVSGAIFRGSYGSTGSFVHACPLPK